MNKILHTKALIQKQNVSETGTIDAIVGSSSVVDRMGDTISQDGWDLKNFTQNPVILWGHNVREEKPPIGKALKVWVENKGKKDAKLMFKVQFDLQDQFAAEIFRKIKDGFLNTVSVGFMPLEWEELDGDSFWGPLKYVKQELLELSVVPVPANPEALIQLSAMAKEDKRFTPVKSMRTLYKQADKEEMAKILHKEDELAEEVAKEEAEEAKEDETVDPVEETEITKDEEVTTEIHQTETTEKVEDKEEAEEVEDDAEEEVEEKEEKAEDTEEAPLLTEVKSVIGAINKAGRVLSSKNESKVRQAMDLLSQVLNELEKQDTESEDPKKDAEEIVSKKALPYKDLGTLPESETWDAQGEISKAGTEELKKMAAWMDDENTEEKSAYKLIHHQAENGNKAVWRGVAASMGALLGAKGGSEIPEEDQKAVYDHLVKHYKEFDKDVPEFKMVEDQVLANFDEEIQAIVLDREDKHMVRLIKKILDNQKETKKKEVEAAKPITVERNIVTQEHARKALEVIAMALLKVDMKKGGN